MKLKFFNYITILLILISGCKKSANNESTDSELKQINITQKTANGDLIFKLESSNAVFNIDDRTTQADNPDIKLFYKNELSYKIIAEKIDLKNSAELINLKGNVIINNHNKSFKLFTDELDWRPNINSINFKNQSEIYLVDIKLVIKSGIWNTKTGNISAKGILEAYKPNIGNYDIVMRANNLSGNLKEGYLNVSDCNYSYQNLNIYSDFCTIKLPTYYKYISMDNTNNTILDKIIKNSTLSDIKQRQKLIFRGKEDKVKSTYIYRDDKLAID